jgi:hypothetical protein
MLVVIGRGPEKELPPGEGLQEHGDTALLTDRTGGSPINAPRPLCYASLNHCHVQLLTLPIDVTTENRKGVAVSVGNFRIQGSEPHGSVVAPLFARSRVRISTQRSVILTEVIQDFPQYI